MNIAPDLNTKKQIIENAVEVARSMEIEELKVACICAKENNKMAIGVDVDQSPLAPDNIISSTMKNVNVSIVNLVGEILEDNYQGGQVIVNTLASGGVGLSDTTKDHVSKDILDYVNEQAGKIKSGEIVVPENEKQYNEIVGK